MKTTALLGCSGTAITRIIADKLKYSPNDELVAPISPPSPPLGERVGVRGFGLRILTLTALLLAMPHGVYAAPALQFASPQRLDNREFAWKLNTPSGNYYRVDVSSNMSDWASLVSTPGNGLLQHTDVSAAYRMAAYYKAQSIPGSNLVTGDHLATTQGDLVIQPGIHATIVFAWNNRTIYIDPGTNQFPSLPKADLILFTHNHTDHFVANNVAPLMAPGGLVVAPQQVYSSISAALKPSTTLMTNGMTTNLLGITIGAVPAYNLVATNFHYKGNGNGYILTMGGKRIYISGDTDNTPEVRALQNIDVAFVCMRLPYTMSATDAADAVRAFKPKVVYPYHFLGSDIPQFKTRVGQDLGIEVRLRKWY